MSSLDPHAPYVLDTRELGRRPGESQRVHRTLPAPEGMQVGLSRVPDGLPLEVDLLLEAVMEGVLVTVDTQVPYVAECARCLDEVHATLPVQAQELVAHPDDTLDEDMFTLDGDLLDLEPVLRDAVVLALPPTVLCSPDCPGLCPECGVRLADEPGHAHDEPTDPRWAALGAVHTDGATDLTASAPADSAPVHDEEN
jgi:uncharacterized protein